MSFEVPPKKMRGPPPFALRVLVFFSNRTSMIFSMGIVRHSVFSTILQRRFLTSKIFTFLQKKFKGNCTVICFLYGNHRHSVFSITLQGRFVPSKKFTFLQKKCNLIYCVNCFLYGNHRHSVFSII